MLRHQTEQAGERTQHTPGPWKIVQPPSFDKSRIGVVHSNGNGMDGQPVYSGVAMISVSRSLNERDRPSEIEQANANLIAAAPDLLHALKNALGDFLAIYNSHVIKGQQIAKAAASNVRAAIAKAEGKA